MEQYVRKITPSAQVTTRWLVWLLQYRNVWINNFHCKLFIQWNLLCRAIEIRRLAIEMLKKLEMHRRGTPCGACFVYGQNSFHLWVGANIFQDKAKLCHFKSVLTRNGLFLRLMRRNAGGNNNQPVKSQPADNLTGIFLVSVVRRIESSAENSRFHQRIFTFLLIT